MKTPSGVVGKYATLQSVAEIGLGSIVHALHIPFGGHFLSLNQGLILTLAARQVHGRKEAVHVCSSIAALAALLKSFSFAGKRLFPMLAISVQGLLYTMGIALFGRNCLGVAVGWILLSLWAFAQPILVYWIIFGGVLFEGIERIWIEAAGFLKISAESGIWILAGLVVFKLILAVAGALLVWNSREGFEEDYREYLSHWANKVNKGKGLGRGAFLEAGLREGAAGPEGASAVTAREGGAAMTAQNGSSHKWRSTAFFALKDLLNPWFVLSLVLSLGFFFFSQHPPATEVLLYAL
ncbi:MAG: hypothetical protein AB1540_17945, partial [Bdellovibrionota bacterium]